MADSRKTRPQPPARRRKDSELIREYDALRSPLTKHANDGEYMHADWHIDDPNGPHQDYHEDVRGIREEHIDFSIHGDSGKPHEGFGDAPSPGAPHLDLNAGHLDWNHHADHPKGEHLDVQYHVDRPGGHVDYHSDWEEGHLDKRAGPDPGFIDV